MNVATRLHSPTRLFQNAKHAEMQNAEQETLNDQRSAKSLTGGISVADFKEPKQQCFDGFHFKKLSPCCVRLSVRTVGFQSTKSGSIPLCSTKFYRRVAAKRILERPVELPGVL